MKNKILLFGLLGGGVALGYYFMKRKPEQMPTMVSKPPIPDSPPSKPEQSFLGATIVREEKDGSSVQTTVKKDPLSNFYKQDTSVKEAKFFMKQIKDLQEEIKKIKKKARHPRQKQHIGKKIQSINNEIKSIEDKLANIGWVKVSDRFVKAGTVLA